MTSAPFLERGGESQEAQVATERHIKGYKYRYTGTNSIHITWERYLHISSKCPAGDSSGLNAKRNPLELAGASYARSPHRCCRV